MLSRSGCALALLSSLLLRALLRSLLLGGLEALFEALRDLESDRVSLPDLDLLTSLRITTVAGLTDRVLEGAEVRSSELIFRL